MNWHIKRIFNTPSHGNPIRNDCGMELINFSPLYQRLRFPVKCNVMIVTGISLLLGASGPSAVIRRVALVVINAVNTVLRGWRLPHVGIEVGKHAPSGANSYATPTVISKAFVFGAMATIDHALPYAVNMVKGLAVFWSSTPATGASAVAKIASGRLCGFPANTDTFPKTFPVLPAEQLNDGKVFKLLAYKIRALLRCLGGLNVAFGHLVLLFRTWCQEAIGRSYRSVASPILA